MLYLILKKSISIFFNIVNILMGRNLPPFTCVCVIVEEQGRYLVLERPEGELVFPGGFMRWRELPIQAAQREGKEETGLDLRIGDIIGYCSIPSHSIDVMSTVSIVFKAEVAGGALHRGIEGQPLWIDEQTLQQKLGKFYTQMFDDYQRYRATKSAGITEQESSIRQK